MITLYKKGEIQGVFLSNGPGEPRILKQEIAEIKKLAEAKIPMLGICLGHQLLSNAFGYATYKMKFGQHGANHPVINLDTKTVEITAQNHNYNVPEELAQVAHITHRNLFGDNVEGVRYKDYPIISVQHHPESSSGPHESKYIFKIYEFDVSIDFLAIISVAFLSSFGHCYSMCGGFNLLFINLNSKSNNLFLLTFIYHLFRIFAYIALGIIFGTFGNILAINAKVQSLSFFILGIFMMILGFALIFRGNMLSFIENNVFFDSFIKKIIKKSKILKD